MMKKNERTKGITLISLVVTIVILLILAGVTIATLIGENGLINKSKESKIQSEIANTKEEIQTEILGKQAEDEARISENDLKKILEKYGELSTEEKLIDKTLTTTKGSYEIKVSDILNGTAVNDMTKGPVVSDKSGANEPQLNKIAQKTYVTWELNEEKTKYEINDKQTTQPDNWYDYENGKWANIKTTNKINDTETLEAYWVWVPRYEYKVPESTQTTATQIEVKFIPTSKINADEGYTIHPAFTDKGNGGFGELDGIWVAKFEASSNTATPDENDGGGEPSDENVLKVQVKPGVQSWRKITPKSIFSVCRKMTKEGEVLAGSTVDSHMMKNTEWGAVAILSQSKYGIFNPKSNIEDPTDGSSRRIWNNHNGYRKKNYIYTGYTGNKPDATTSSVSTTAPAPIYTYDTINGTKGSTTGTVYGVYDMAGGSFEIVAGVLKGEEDELEYAKSQFNISNLEEANKYLDLYDYRASSNDYSQYIIGDALIETKGWNGDYNYNFVYPSGPVFKRGRISWCRN